MNDYNATDLSYKGINVLVVYQFVAQKMADVGKETVYEYILSGVQLILQFGNKVGQSKKLDRLHNPGRAKAVIKFWRGFRTISGSSLLAAFPFAAQMLLDSGKVVPPVVSELFPKKFQYSQGYIYLKDEYIDYWMDWQSKVSAQISGGNKEKAGKPATKEQLMAWKTEAKKNTHAYFHKDVKDYLMSPGNFKGIRKEDLSLKNDKEEPVYYQY